MPEILYLQTALKSFFFYSSLIVLFPALLLNLIAFLVFLRKKFWRNTTMGYFYSVYSFISMITVAVGILAYFPTSIDQDLAVKSKWSCKILWLARAQMVQTSSYFSVFMTLDRTLSIVFPRRFHFLGKYKHLVFITVMIILVVAGINMIHWWRYLVVIRTTFGNETTSCTMCTQSDSLLFFNSVGSLASRVIPLFSNLIMNVIIIRALVKSKIKFRRYYLSKTNVDNGIQKESRKSHLTTKEYSFAISLLAMNFIYFVVTLPVVTLNLLQIYTYLNTVPTYLVHLTTVLYSFTFWGNYFYDR